MNIVYIHTHDTGTYIQPYGYPAPAPNLQRLADEGILFRHAFCAGPTCSPSRAGLLTGMTPHSCGMLGLAHRGFALDDYGKHLVRLLNRQGYETALSGIQHEALREETIGYRVLLNRPGMQHSAESDRMSAQAAADYLRSKPGSPFFLSVGLFNTHRDFPDPAQDDRQEAQPPPPITDVPETRTDMAGYLASLRIADECIGVVLSALSESGLSNETLVLFTTDHGLPFPMMKSTMYDAGIRVAFILKLPGRIVPGTKSDALVSHLDLLPTLFELSGLQPPNGLQGRSLVPILDGVAEEVNEEVFAEMNFHACYEPIRCIRTKRYKLIRRFDPGEPAALSNIDDSPTKQYLLDCGLKEWMSEREELQLYDLILDPAERHNVAGNPRYQKVLSDLSMRLNTWMLHTNDPLLHGRVPIPWGARVNVRSCVSPGERDYER